MLHRAQANRRTGRCHDVARARERQFALVVGLIPFGCQAEKAYGRSANRAAAAILDELDGDIRPPFLPPDTTRYYPISSKQALLRVPTPVPCATLCALLCAFEWLR